MEKNSLSRREFIGKSIYHGGRVGLAVGVADGIDCYMTKHDVYDQVSKEKPPVRPEVVAKAEKILADPLSNSFDNETMRLVDPLAIASSTRVVVYESERKQRIKSVEEARAVTGRRERMIGAGVFGGIAAMAIGKIIETGSLEDY